MCLSPEEVSLENERIGFEVPPNRLPDPAMRGSLWEVTQEGIVDILGDNMRVEGGKASAVGQGRSVPSWGASAAIEG